jgi:hypothetical protein
MKGSVTDEQAVVVASCEDPNRARGMAAALRKAKILATVMVSGYVAGEVDVIVFASDAEAARSILADLEDSETL